MGMLTGRDETTLQTRAGLGTMTSHPLLSFCTAASCLPSPPSGTLPSTPPLLQRRSPSNSHHCSMLILGSQLGALKPCFSPFFLSATTHSHSHSQIAPPARLLCLPSAHLQS